MSSLTIGSKIISSYEWPTSDHLTICVNKSEKEGLVFSVKNPEGKITIVPSKRVHGWGGNNNNEALSEKFINNCVASCHSTINGYDIYFSTNSNVIDLDISNENDLVIAKFELEQARKDSQNPEQLVKALSEIAKYSISAKKYEEALNYLQEALDLDSSNIENLLEMSGECLVHLSKTACKIDEKSSKRAVILNIAQDIYAIVQTYCRSSSTPMSKSDSLPFIKFIQQILKNSDIDALYSGWSLLHYCVYICSYYHYSGCKERIINLVEYLIHNGANVNCQDSQGRTPLFFCGDELLLKLLLENGANPSPCPEKTTPLHMAASLQVDITGYKNSSSIQTWLGTPDLHKRTPLHYATISNKDVGCQTIIELLALAPQHADCLDCFGNSPYYYALQYGDEEAQAILIKYTSPTIREQAICKIENLSEEGSSSEINEIYSIPLDLFYFSLSGGEKGRSSINDFLDTPFGRIDYYEARPNNVKGAGPRGICFKNNTLDVTYRFNPNPHYHNAYNKKAKKFYRRAALEFSNAIQVIGGAPDTYTFSFKSFDSDFTATKQ